MPCFVVCWVVKIIFATVLNFVLLEGSEIVMDQRLVVMIENYPCTLCVRCRLQCLEASHSWFMHHCCCTVIITSRYLSMCTRGASSWKVQRCFECSVDCTWRSINSSFHNLCLLATVLCWRLGFWNGTAFYKFVPLRSGYLEILAIIGFVVADVSYSYQIYYFSCLLCVFDL